MSDDNDKAEVPAGFVTRAGVASRLNISHATVRRMEVRGDLRPRIASTGIRWFDPVEIDALEKCRAVRKRSARPTAEARPAKTNDSAAFQLFKGGTSHADAVITLGISSEEVRRLYREFQAGYREPQAPADRPEADGVTGAEDATADEWQTYEREMQALTLPAEEGDAPGSKDPARAAQRRARRRALLGAR